MRRRDRTWGWDGPIRPAFVEDTTQFVVACAVVAAPLVVRVIVVQIAEGVATPLPMLALNVGVKQGNFCLWIWAVGLMVAPRVHCTSQLLWCNDRVVQP